LISASPAGAVADSEELTQFGSQGAGAGQFYVPSGTASDPVTGHVYTFDSANKRVDEFTAWGDFVKAWGWGVADGSNEFQTCTTFCQEGIAGAGKGQFNQSGSIEIDAVGGLYANDFLNRRVQKFDSSGQFVLMFGKGVNKTTGGDVCTAVSGDECGPGTLGNGPGEFSESGGGFGISPTGTILVGGVGRIQEFEPDGDFKGEFKVAGTVGGIAADPTGSGVYATYLGKDGIHKFDFSGTEVLPPIEISQPSSIVTDPTSGNIYVISFVPGASPSQRVVEFDPSGVEVSSCCVPAFVPEGEGYRFALTGLGTNGAGDLYVVNRSVSPYSSQHITVFGPPPLIYGDPPKVSPEITDQLLASADSTSAVLKAEINPNFWKDTRYFLEYGPAPCGLNPCTQQPVSPGAELGAGGVKKSVTTSGVLLSGLTPNTVYHYRFVTESGGGGPVFGPDETFTTFPVSPAPDACPANQAFRTGPSANLPDCRAYEMVSPVDKNNGDIKNLIDITGYETRLNQVSADGEALAYTSYRAFGGAEGGPYISQYLSRRGSQGWSGKGLGGPLTGNFLGASFFEDEFKAFSPDLCSAWLMPGGEPTLAPGAVAGFPNLYRRDICSAKGYEALTTAEPPSPRKPEEYVPELQGYSADGIRAIFRVNDKLTEDARGPGISQVYEAVGETLRTVCVFPEGTSAKAEGEFPHCSAGSLGNETTATAINRTASVSHAMSEDGSRIYWSASAEPSGLGKIYLRVDGTTTLKVSEAPGDGQTTKPAQFWGASPDGSRALYTVADPNQEKPTPKDKGLYLYDLGAEESALVAPKVRAVLATSEDLSRVYFVSEAVLPGTTGATAGKANLYLHDGGADAFIATLSAADVGPNGSPSPVFHVARATPDGGRLAFVSEEPLTGFDSTDLVSGEADSEVFSYDAATAQLICASCSPAGVRPKGRKVSPHPGFGDAVPLAASIPVGENQLYAPRVLADDGKRLFFTSYTGLLPADTNGKADVYEWEEIGDESCQGTSDPDYYAANGGCLFLISSGESPSDSELIDSSPSGRDVFFTTNASLLPQDPGLIDIYDARSGGGFPPPATPAAACEGEACQGPLSPPEDPTPGSSSFQGAGNVKETSKAKKHKKKAQKKKHAKKRAHRAAKHNRRDAR
jgi:hypothetical protein